MKLSIVLTPEAREHVRELGKWWRKNREKAPNLFRDQLRKTLETLSRSPNIGRAVDEEGLADLRVYPLKKTPYLVFYVAAGERGELQVHAVWSSMREEGPPLT